MSGKNLIGLDIGSKFTKIIQIREKNGIRFLTKAHLINTPGDLDLEDSIMLQSFLEKLAHDYSLKRKDIAFALNISECIARYLTMPIVEESSINQTILQEAEQYIPFKLDKVNIGYQILDIDKENKEMKVLIVAAKKERINFLKEVFKKAKLNLQCIDVDILATINAYLENTIKKDKLVFILNIGARSTKLVLLDGILPIYFNNIDFSLDSLIVNVANGLLISEYESLNLLLKQDKDDTLIKIIESNLVKLKNEISNTLNFNFSLIADRSIDNFVIAGGACLINEISNYLSIEFDKEVEKINPFETFTIEDKSFKSENKCFFNVALGLALRTI